MKIQRPLIVALGVAVGLPVAAQPIEFVELSGGQFQMGCPPDHSEDCLSDESAVTVDLSAFAIARYEVTNAQFAEFLNENGNRVKLGTPWYTFNKFALIEEVDGRFQPKPGFERYPVTNVSWFGADAFANWLSERDGRRYGLPTEAQWEYAARGGADDTGSRFSGGDELESVAWCDDFAAGSKAEWGTRNSNGVHSVGQKRANALGLFDMSGNVREWTSTDYENRLAPGRDPKGPSTASFKVARGGSWDSGADDCRVTARTASELPGSRFVAADGFRLVREADTP